MDNKMNNKMYNRKTINDYNNYKKLKKRGINDNDYK